MTKKTDNSISVNDVSRCQHLFTNKMRCRLPIAANSLSFCALHRQPDEQDTADISTIVSANAEDFQTAKGILSSLSDLYLLLSKARISPRRASTLAYISSLQLRALPMAFQEIESTVSDYDRLFAGTHRSLVPGPVEDPAVYAPTNPTTPSPAQQSVANPDPKMKPS
jgi:hypothetical protein